jgi:hypothetical protein
MKSSIWEMQLPRAHKDNNTETDKRRCLEDATSFAYKGDTKGIDEIEYFGLPPHKVK